MRLLLIVLFVFSGGCYGYRPGYYDSCGFSGSRGFIALFLFGGGFYNGHY
jgi:hypothetical protein